jgi:hypothetical protein
MHAAFSRDMSVGLSAWSITKTWAWLWRNPWATQPLEIKLPLPEASIDPAGRVELHEASDAPAKIFGLDPGWPGPEEPSGN